MTSERQVPLQTLLRGPARVLWQYAGGYEAEPADEGYAEWSVHIPPIETNSRSAPTLFVRAASGTLGSGTSGPELLAAQGAATGGIAGPGVPGTRTDSVYLLKFDADDDSTHLAMPVGRFTASRGSEFDDVYYADYSLLLPYATSSRGFLAGGTLTLRVKTGFEGTVVSRLPSQTASSVSTPVPSTFPDADAGAIAALLIDTGVLAEFDIDALDFPVSHSTETYREVSGGGSTLGMVGLLCAQGCIPADFFAFNDYSYTIFAPDGPGDSIKLTPNGIHASANGAYAALFPWYSPSNARYPVSATHARDQIFHSFGFPDFLAYAYLLQGVLLVPSGARSVALLGWIGSLTRFSWGRVIGPI